LLIIDFESQNKDLILIKLFLAKLSRKTLDEKKEDWSLEVVEKKAKSWQKSKK